MRDVMIWTKQVCGLRWFLEKLKNYRTLKILNFDSLENFKPYQTKVFGSKDKNIEDTI
jgi:hypothetical protein